MTPVLARMVAVTVAIALLAACARDRRVGEVTAPVASPFAPVSLRIHPLTRMDAPSHMIVLHVELRDEWGEPVKGVGSLLVELYRPAEGPDAGLESRELVWEVNLSNLELNHRLYDPATRTYRLQLTELPAWLEESPGRVRLHAVLVSQRAGDGQPEAVRMEDTYLLRY